MDFDEIFGGVMRGLSTNRLDCGGNPITPSLFRPNFSHPQQCTGIRQKAEP